MILGIFNYFKEYIPNIVSISAPLRKLFKLNVYWNWLLTLKKY